MHLVSTCLRHTSLQLTHFNLIKLPERIFFVRRWILTWGQRGERKKLRERRNRCFCLAKEKNTSHLFAYYLSAETSSGKKYYTIHESGEWQPTGEKETKEQKINGVHTSPSTIFNLIIDDLWSPEVLQLFSPGSETDRSIGLYRAMHNLYKQIHGHQRIFSALVFFFIWK